MAGIFARIASGEIPSYKIAEDDRFFRTKWNKQQSKSRPLWIIEFIYADSMKPFSLKTVFFIPAKEV